MPEPSSVQDRQVHVLKTWPEMYEAVETGRKTVELRRDDRGYRVGDFLLLHCYDPETDEFRPFRLVREVTHIVKGGAWGLQLGFVAMSLRDPGIHPSWFDPKPAVRDHPAAPESPAEPALRADSDQPTKPDEGLQE